MRGLEKSRPFYFAAYSTAIMKIIFRRYSSMKKIKLWVKTTFAVCSLCAPIPLMIIGIWMIYNVGLWIGLGVDFIGYAGTLYACCTTLEVIKSRKN